MLSSKIKVAVLRGGPSSEYDHSLKTGNHVLSVIREIPDKYEPLDIFISKNGEWHTSGIVSEPHDALRHADVVWNALHGSYGEDGQVQKLLENLQLPFTGSGSLASVLALNKDMAKEAFLNHSILVPQHELLTQEDFTDDRLIHIFRTYLHPVVIKPSRGWGSVGISLAHSFQELKEKIKSSFKHSPKVMVEERIIGKDISCGVIDHARGERSYALIPNGVISAEEKREVENISKLAHQALGLRHYSLSDFIITPKGRVYLIETNTQPKLHEESHFYKSLQEAGWKNTDFVEHCLNLALKRRS